MFYNKRFKSLEARIKQLENENVMLCDFIINPETKDKVLEQSRHVSAIAPRWITIYEYVYQKVRGY